MPWVRNGKEIRIGKGWTGDDDVQHPANWASVWSDSEIQQKGLTWVDPPASFDGRFYYAADIEQQLLLLLFVFALCLLVSRDVDRLARGMKPTSRKDE